MQIGQISELSGYSQRMIRYLEDQGLIAPHRSDSNLRRFEDKDLTRILKIKRLKELGFSYSEIKSFIDKDESVFAERGIEVLKRHHEDAHELMEKIRQLEVICFGEIKTQMVSTQKASYLHPMRTAYRIRRLEEIWSDIIALRPELTIDVSLWKFGELQLADDLKDLHEVEAFEIFRASSVMVLLEGESFLPTFVSVFEKHLLSLNPQTVGSFSASDASEFFGRSEIVINYKILDPSGEKVFHAILPYQAIFIASGELE